MAFLGWYTSPTFDSGTGPYMPGETVPAGESGLDLYAKWIEPPVLKKGTEVNVIFKSLAAGTEISNYTQRDDKLHGIRQSSELPSNGTEIREIQESGVTVYAWFDSSDGYICYYSESPILIMNEDSMGLLCFIRRFTDISCLANWDARHVTNMSGMFAECTVLSDYTAIKDWDTGNVVYMTSMFQSTYIDDLSPFEKWDTGNVKDMNYMFSYCSAIESLTGLEKWNTENVTNMFGMFMDSNFLEDLSALSNWETKNVSDMGKMFDSCRYMKDISPLSKWNTGSVTSMNAMFEHCYNITDPSALADWDTKSVTDMMDMFMGCSITDASALEHWNVGNETKMDNMFGSDCTKYPSWYK